MESNKAQEHDAIRELKWKEIMSRVDAYRFYLKLCLEASAFFFATTGVILGFYLNDPTTPPSYYLKFFLLLPILMGTVLGSICIYAARLQKEGSRNIKEVREELDVKHGLKIELIPDVHLLDLVLIIFGFIFFLVAALLIPVPLLKEAAFLRYFEWFGGIAGLILVGGVISAIFGIRKYDKNLKKAKERRSEEARAGQPAPITPSIGEKSEQHKKVALGEGQMTASSGEQEANNTGGNRAVEGGEREMKKSSTEKVNDQHMLSKLKDHVVQVEAMIAYLLLCVVFLYVLDTVAESNELHLPVWLIPSVLLIGLSQVVRVKNPNGPIRNALVWAASIGGVIGAITGATADVITGGLTGGQGTLIGYAAGAAVGGAAGNWIESWGKGSDLMERGKAFEYLYKYRNKNPKIANPDLINKALDDEIKGFDINNDGRLWYTLDSLKDYLKT